MTNPTSSSSFRQQATVLAGLLKALPSILSLAAVGFAIVVALRAQATARQLGLDAANAAARADTVRRMDEASLLLAVQSAIHASAVELTEHQAPVVVIHDTVSAPAVEDTVRAPVTGDSIRAASFDVRQPPYTAHATVALPATGAGSLALSIAQDPIPLETRVECGTAAAGIRAAQVRVSAPPLYRLGLSQPQVDPDVCNPPRLTIGVPWKVGIGLGLGLFVLGWLRP